jgi:hypothetical protein
MYRHAEKHNLTGFEAAGVMLALATEVMASALVRDGLLQGGPDWVEEVEDATDATDALAASDALADMMAAGKQWSVRVEHGAGTTDADPETTEPDPQARINELLGETQWLREGLDKTNKLCTELTEANAGLEEALRGMAELQREMREERSDSQSARIAQLEDALRTMADFALIEIKEHQARLAETVVTGVTAEELRIKELEVLRQFPWLTAREARIKDLLHRCGLGLTLPNQEPQS